MEKHNILKYNNLKGMIEQMIFTTGSYKAIIVIGENYQSGE
jgi:hypothetical protein